MKLGLDEPLAAIVARVQANYLAPPGAEAPGDWAGTAASQL